MEEGDVCDGSSGRCTADLLPFCHPDVAAYFSAASALTGVAAVVVGVVSHGSQ